MLHGVSLCPPADALAAFACGELQAANAESVRVHVSLCELCLQTVAKLVTASQASSGLAGGIATPFSLRSGPGYIEIPFAEHGQLIGPYRLIEELGAGGMGEVWKAEQLAPVRRSVAMKLLKAGMDTRSIVARFDAERQVLALMQHPGIAQVFDAGVTAAGRPYFVMEYVDGIRITRYCDDTELTVLERLALFQQVCDAVQHAHRKGVIHRDIKPSNVLVTIQNGLAQPKIIDFGLAKLTAPQGRDATLTELGTLLGTPAYASPEQLSLGGIDVDTRSDVYSLGVLLYELLTGVIPFESRDVRANALLELQRSIKERDPPRPSTRLGALGEHAAEVVKLRRTDRRALRRQLHGDLDRIVMKALERDRSRRYGSPGDLALDIGRYLDDQPVLAASPTAAYRVRKFVKRHYVGTAFACLFFLSSVSFATLSALQVQRITVERDRATSEAAKASSVNRFLQDTLAAADPWRTGSDISIRETLKHAAEKADASFKDQPLLAASVQHTLGKAYLGLGRLDDAEREIRAALRTRTTLLGPEHADVAESLADLADLDQARANYEAADSTSLQALNMRRRLLGNDDPLVAESLFNRSVLLKSTGKFDEAAQAATEALAIREHIYGPVSSEVAEVIEWLGVILASGKGEIVRGEEFARRGYELHLQLVGPDDLRTALSASNLGSLSIYARNNEQAEKFYRIALAGELRHLGPNHPDTITATENLANALRRLGRFEESYALVREVLARRRAVLGDDNRLVARTMVNLATVLSTWGRLDEAQSAFAEAVPKLLRAYGPDHPDSAHSLYAYGVLRLKRQEYAEAARLLRQALSIQLKSFSDDHRDIADTRLNLGRSLTELHQFTEAEQVLLRAQEAMLKAYGAESTHVREAASALDRLHAIRSS